MAHPQEEHPAFAWIDRIPAPEGALLDGLATSGQINTLDEAIAAKIAESRALTERMRSLEAVPGVGRIVAGASYAVEPEQGIDGPNRNRPRSSWGGSEMGGSPLRHPFFGVGDPIHWSL